MARIRAEVINMEKNISRLGKFYIILTVILALVGVGAYIFARSSAKKSVESITVPTRESYRYEEPTEVNNEVGSVVDERYTITPTEPESTAEPKQIISRDKTFCLPMGNKIFKDYSDGQLVYSETMEDWRAHTGVDFTGKKGSDILAVNNGKVLRVYDSSLLGTVIEIDHGEGMVAKYCPIDPDGFVINEGDNVKTGQKIGTLGVIPIESADEEHLHFEITVYGKYTDPIEAMGKSRDSLS